VDNAGENRALKAFLTANGFANVEFEFTPRNSPQFNGKIERKIAVLWSRTKSTQHSKAAPMATQLLVAKGFSSFHFVRKCNCAYKQNSLSLQAVSW